MFNVVVRLADLTVLLLNSNNEVVMAVSYRTNAQTLLNLLKRLEIENLYLIVNPLPINENLITIHQWKNTDIQFGLDRGDIKTINRFFGMLTVKNGYLVNMIDCFDHILKVDTFNTVQVWAEKYALISVYNNKLTGFELYDDMHELLSKHTESSYLKDDYAVLDLTKISALHKEIAKASKQELALLGPMMNAIVACNKISLPIEDEELLNTLGVDNESEEVIDIRDTEMKQQQLLPEEPTITEDTKLAKQEKPNTVSSEETVRKKSHIKFRNFALIGIAILSLVIGVTAGTKQQTSYIDALNAEKQVLLTEQNRFSQSSNFFKRQLSILSGEQKSISEIYKDISQIKANGILYDFKYNGSKIVLTYYMLDKNSPDAVSEAINEKYSVESVTHTDTLTVQNKAINVYTITINI